MKLQKKHLSAAIALALTLTIAATFITSVPVPAQMWTGTKISTKAWISETPNPVKLGGTVLITGWITPPPEMYTTLSTRYFNFTFTITKPDGTKEEVFLREYQSVAAESINYVCNQ